MLGLFHKNLMEELVGSSVYMATNWVFDVPKSAIVLSNSSKIEKLPRKKKKGS